MSKVEFSYKDENKEEHVLEYDTKTCMEALELWNKHLKKNHLEDTKISHMSVIDRNWKGEH